MSKYKGEILHVNLTEKVGNNTWYRGKINDEGKNIWLHPIKVEKMEIKAEKKSLLAKEKGGIGQGLKRIGAKSFKATAKYQNQVYYVKRKEKEGQKTFY